MVFSIQCSVQSAINNHKSAISPPLSPEERGDGIRSYMNLLDKQREKEYNHCAVTVGLLELPGWTTD